MKQRLVDTGWRTLYVGWQLIWPPRALPFVFRTEWGENWSAWPHCCTQARCWMHVSAQWCDCRCRWCRIARHVHP